MADFTVEMAGDSGSARAQGPLDLQHAREARQALAKAIGNARQATLDMGELTRLDTVGAMLLREAQEKNKGLRFTGFRPEHAALFDLVAKADIALPELRHGPSPLVKLICRLGQRTVAAYHSTIEIIAFFGQVCAMLMRNGLSLKRLRLPDISHHIEDTGIDAIPIVALIAFMIAIVLAYQGLAQLRPYGGEQFTVNLVAISVLREMAIMVAGRSGSAFTAQIGVMKVNEEVDALKVIGIEPFEVLVLPRLIALLIAMPLLTFIADIMGLLGGAVISTLMINIPLGQYLARVQSAVHGHDFMVGMIKAPVFAFLIAIVGCMHGMKVSGSAESVGKETTASVVKSIFLVLGADAIFSVVFQKLGI
jgi:phospholipid/cholesterol/gamma-HCH transport system permease protein